MYKISRITLITLLLLSCSPSIGFALAGLELGASDVKCRWSDKDGRSRTEICHITEAGTHMGETVMTFSIGLRPFSYSLNYNSKSAFLTKNSDKNYRVLWKGTFRSRTSDMKGARFTETISLSDGMTIVFHR